MLAIRGSDGVIVIDGETIVAVGGDVPAGAEVLDATRLTVSPGFWNSHVHLFERKWANAAELPADELQRQLDETFLRFGFTTVFDLGSPRANTRALRARIDSGEVRGPRILTTGEGLVPPGAMPSADVFRVMGVMPLDAPELTSAADAERAAGQLLDEGADGIKLFASTPRGAALAPEIVAAAVRVAHDRGKPAFIHPNRGDDVVTALAAGVDVIAHTTPSSGPWNDALLRAVGPHAALTPTLALWRHFLRHDRISVREQLVGTAVAQLRAWRTAGGTVLFGTDLGAVDADPAEEYALMREAGMSRDDLLASLTTTPAARFGDAGRIALGARADLVLFDGDPERVRYTICRGAIAFAAS